MDLKIDSKVQLTDTDADNDTDNLKLDIKNIALKAPKKSKTSENSFWRVFWINNIPKREGIYNIKREYLQVIENMDR